jgi:uncharacterized coiled-coil protein SlyX
MDLEGRVTELEIKVAFQERLLADLDEVVRALRTEIEALRTEHGALVDQLEAHRGPIVDEKPPHW